MKAEELSLSGKDLTGFIQDTLAKGNSFRFKAKGFSMSPFIRDNDMVTVSPLFGSSIGFGQPVVFIHPKIEKVFIHRVVGRSGNCYLIKGDNLNWPDGLVPEKNILGRVSSIERNGKKVFLGLGPERLLFGLFSRWFLLFSLLFFLRRFLRPIIRRKT